MPIYVNLPETQAVSVAAQVFSEIEDSQFEKLFMRVVREGKYRHNLDFEGLLKKAAKQWGVEKAKPAKAGSFPEDKPDDSKW